MTQSGQTPDRPWSALRWGGPAIVDQVLSSGTQLLLVVLVARSAPAAVFGAVSVAVLVHGFLLGSVRALVADVVLIRCRRAGSDTDHEARLGLFLAIAFGIAGGALVAIAGLVVGGEVGRFLLLFAGAVPFVHGQEVLRSVAYGERRLADAVVLDGVWMAVQVLVTVALLLVDGASARLLVLAWALGAGASLLSGCVRRRLRPSGRGARSWISADRKRGLGFLGDFTISTGVIQASFLVLGATLPLAQFGTFRLAFVSVSPLANVMAGVRSLTLARLAEVDQDRARAASLARRAAIVFATFATTYGLVLGLLPAAAGVAVFGSTWRAARHLVAFVALGEVFRMGTLPAIDLLKVVASPGLLVRTRIVTSCLLVGGILVGGATAGARGAVVGTAVALAAAGLVWWSRVRAIERQPPWERSESEV